MIDNSHWLELQKSLGPRGLLGIGARLFGPLGERQGEIMFNADNAFPMASTAKIAIAMLAASRIESGQLSLHEQISIDPKLLTPGLAHNPLDHLFYYPFQTRRTETVDRLLDFMIRDSDNTATDLLLKRLGGMPGVADFVKDLGITGMHLNRTFSQLVTFYYRLKLPTDRRPRIGQIVAAVRRLRPPYIYREITEDALIASGEDCSTPRAMTELLTILVTQPAYRLAYSYMEHCAGGLGRIRKGLAGQSSSIKSFAHKTGTMGGIANDAGIVEFIDGSSAAICIMTCRGSAPMQVRDEQIAKAARAIMAARGARL